MIIKSYVEEGIDPEEAKTGWVSERDDHVRRHGLIRSCVDGFIEYEFEGKKGIFFAYRDAVPPFQNKIWTPGGEWKRGIMDPVKALRLKIKEETNLDISEEEYLGMVNVLWKESPYDSDEFKKERKNKKLGKGIHDISHVFFAKAKGELKLKSMKPPVILVTEDNYETFVEEHNPHDYLKSFLKEALKKTNFS